MDNLTIEIDKVLKEFTTEVEDGLEKLKEKYAKEGAETLKVTSPRDTGNYAKGWRARKTKEGWVIYNSTKPHLTHLLEKGHAKVGGGRVAGRPHIAPVEEKIIKDFEREIEKVIRG